MKRKHGKKTASDWPKGLPRPPQKPLVPPKLIPLAGQRELPFVYSDELAHKR